MAQRKKERNNDEQKTRDHGGERTEFEGARITGVRGEGREVSVGRR
jgi:hypothetical protein